MPKLWTFLSRQNFFQKIEHFFLNREKILNFEFLTVSFCMGPTIMYCSKVVSSNPPKNLFAFPCCIEDKIHNILIICIYDLSLRQINLKSRGDHQFEFLILIWKLIHFLSSCHKLFIIWQLLCLLYHHLPKYWNRL